MTERRAAARTLGAAARPKIGKRVRGFALWQTPRSPLVLILSVEALCVTSLVVANVWGTARSGDFYRFLLLAGVAVVYDHAADRIERIRVYIGGHTDNRLMSLTTSLWCFAAALVLPIGLAGLVASVVFANIVAMSWRHRSGQPYRLTYTAATEVLATLAAALVIEVSHAGGARLGASPASLLAVVVALACYVVINQGLVRGVVHLVIGSPSLRDSLIDSEEQALELATLALAVLFAVSIVHAPWVSPVALVVILVLRRTALVRELQVQATRDAKTGLLNAGAWRTAARRDLSRAERLRGTATLLMIDLDHFKLLNDEFGHPAGDAALRAVADALRDALRGYDAVGRFGGEEFVALLADADERTSLAVADRVRSRIAALKLEHGSGITASVGVGIGSADPAGLDALLKVADRALYEAKSAGRNTVRVGYQDTVKRAG